MVKRLLLIAFMSILASCSSDDQPQATENNSFTMPDSYLGIWKGSDDNKLMTIYEHQIILELENGETRNITNAIQGAYSQENSYNNLFLNEDLSESLGFNVHAYGYMYVVYQVNNEEVISQYYSRIP